jgi:hypothetical protein
MDALRLTGRVTRVPSPTHTSRLGLYSHLFPPYLLAQAYLDQAWTSDLYNQSESASFPTESRM